MKEKIIIFIVGLLLGAIISTGSIYFYTVADNKNNSNEQTGMQMPGGNPPGENGGMGENGGQPPELPNNNSQNSKQSA